MKNTQELLEWMLWREVMFGRVDSTKKMKFRLNHVCSAKRPSQLKLLYHFTLGSGQPPPGKGSTLISLDHSWERHFWCTLEVTRSCWNDLIVEKIRPVTYCIELENGKIIRRHVHICFHGLSTSPVSPPSNNANEMQFNIVIVNWHPQHPKLTFSIRSMYTFLVVYIYIYTIYIWCCLATRYLNLITVVSLNTEAVHSDHFHKWYSCDW